MSVPAAMRRLVVERSGKRCEYCLMPQDYDLATFEIDHIIPEKMGGRTLEENLALACFKCNNHKGPNIAAIDPKTDEKVFLFNPRQDDWSDHFQWDGPVLVGTTSIGRGTVALLQINQGHRIAHRRQLMTEGVFPFAVDK